MRCTPRGNISDHRDLSSRHVCLENADARRAPWGLIGSVRRRRCERIAIVPLRKAGATATTSNAKADSTRRSSQAVPHPSTNRALRRLTSEVGRDPVCSTRYGRQREIGPEKRLPFISRPPPHRPAHRSSHGFAHRFPNSPVHRRKSLCSKT